MVKIRGKLAIRPYIYTKVASKSKKLLWDILSLAKSDNREITTCFYCKKQEYSTRIGLGPNS